ncbi:MAG TPA: hypothetical protein VLF66_12605 [Thermoanaerobaculia bacterium]|nr:hypothetical protein [Thermoanaerobaculia bacterium]
MLPSDLADLAPGALVAAAAALLHLALGRWYDRVPRRVTAVFALVLVLLFAPVLLGGSVLLPLDGLRGEPPFRGLPPTDPHGNLLQGDLLYLVHPLELEVRRAVSAGAWPLRSPHLGAGLALLADPQAQALQPLAALGWALQPEAAPGAVAALRTLVALAFAFLLLRRLGAGRGSATAGALAYGLGGYLQLWLGWPLANTAALLPAALYAVVLADERGARRDWGLLAGSLACLLAAGHPETVGYALGLVGALASLRLRVRPRIGPGAQRAFAGRLVGAAALAVLLAAPTLLPFAEALPESLRWSRARGSSELSSGVAPATRLVQVAVPNAFGNSRFIHYWGLRNSNEDAAGFVGTAALLASLLALPGWAARRRPLRHEGAALLVAGGCLVLLALPGDLGGWVPGKGLSGRLALPLVLALAVLAAATWERFRRGGLPRWLTRGALPASVALLAALHPWAVATFAHPEEPERLEVLRWGWGHWHLRVLAAAAIALLAASFLRRRGWLGPVMALLVGAELLLAHRPVNPPMPAGLYYPETPALAFLDEALPEGPGAPRVAAVGRVLLPNAAAVYGFADVRVFDPMAPAAYFAALQPGVQWTGEIPLLAPEAVGRPALDRLGVAWVMTAPEEACPEGSEPAYRGPDANLCHRPGALPLLRVEGAGSGAAAALEDLRADPGGDRWSGRPAGAGGGRFVTGLFGGPGWRVLADGRTVPPEPGPFLAAALPAGARRVDLLYRPAPFLAGLLAAALGLAAGAAWLARPPSLTGARRGSPRSAPTPPRTPSPPPATPPGRPPGA